MNHQTISSIAKIMQEMHDLDESKIKLGTKVKIVGGHKDKIGQVGRVREIRHGLHKTAPKTYSIYHDDGSWTDAQKEHIRISE